MFLYLTFALCGLGAAALVYRYDLYDREPIPAAALAVGLGAAVMALADPLERLIFAYLRTESPAGLAAVAALVEEGLKLLVVVVFAVLSRRIFNDPMDGLIYGSLAGLGAALEEGVAVLRNGARSGLFLPPEELVRLAGHLVMGGVGGFGVGRLLTRPSGSTGRAAGPTGNAARPLARELGAWVAVGLGFLAAASLHFGWDLLALRADPFREGAPREALLGAALMLAGFVLYGRLVVVTSRWSQRVFAPTAPRSLLGWPWRRRKS